LFFLRALSSHVKRLEAKVDREKIVLSVLPELSIQILELANERGRITMTEVVVLTSANRNTVKVHLRKLVDMGHLKQHGAGRGVWYARN
jgi:predicted HTH transcriptional regulator